MDERYEIRPVRPEDAPGIAALRRMPGIVEDTMGLPSCRDTDSADFVEDLGDNDHYFVAVAEDGTVIGSAGLAVYSHGEYFALGKRLGTFGYSVKRRKN